MIKIALEGERYRPIILCSWCKKPIKDMDGNYQWKTGWDGEPIDGKIYFTHKKCNHAFELYNQSSDWFWSAIDITEFPFRLAANLGFSVEASSGDNPIFINCGIKGKLLTL